MPEAAAILARLDAAIRELLELRSEVEGLCHGDKTLPDDADDLSEASLIEISQAVQLFNRPADSLRWMCRTQACGKKIAGRWMASPARISRWLNGG